MMKWRLLEEASNYPVMNVALDHAIYESVSSGKKLPTIRFYRFDNDTISISAYQPRGAVKTDAILKQNIEIVRRFSGGKEIFFGRNDFAYSVFAPLKLFNFKIRKAFEHFSYCIIDSLIEAGIKASLSDRKIIAGGKIISQGVHKIMDNGIYFQQGVVHYDSAFPKNILNMQKSQNTTSISKIRNIERNEIYGSLKENFLFNKDFSAEEVSDHEKSLAKKLVEAKYGSFI